MIWELIPTHQPSNHRLLPEKDWYHRLRWWARCPDLMKVSWYKSQPSKPKLGIHLDLDGGKPVSDAFRNEYGSEKLFYRVVESPQTNITSKCYLELDINAKLIDSGNRTSHRFSSPQTYQLAGCEKLSSDLVRKFEISRIRVAGNVLYPSALHKQVYRSLLNQYFMKSGNPENPYSLFCQTGKIHGS